MNRKVQTIADIVQVAVMVAVGVAGAYGLTRLIGELLKQSAPYWR